ncbi:cortex morphogenetic protein CmpA [Paenibacillus turpanensis]|nr:cortex morphogenetic protein CmpA [Paenibacillus turpanensis]
MPNWLRTQLMRAFLTKNRRQIRLLNDCWYFYRDKQGGKTAEKKTTSH